MTSGKALKLKRVSPEEILEVALAAEVPSHVSDACMVVVVGRGGKLDNGDPDGKGVTTQYGVAWLTEGKHKSEPIALYESQADALALYKALVGEEGELWDRKRRRREANAAAEAAEAAAEAEAKESGGGSPRRRRSSVKRSGEIQHPLMQKAERRLSRTTSSRPSSS